MKTIKMLILAFVLALAPPAFAQSTATQTTLSVALGGGSANTQVTVAGATGMSASTSSSQTFIYITDASGQGEQMQIRSIAGNILTVSRAIRGVAVPHALNALVWYGGPATFNVNSGDVGGGPGTAPAVFVGTTPFGRCTRANNPVLPVVNPNTGEISDCLLSPPQGSPTAAEATTSAWVSTSAYGRGHSSPYNKMPITATTYTLTAADRILGYNTAAAGTITIPALTGWVGKEYIIQLEITGAYSVTVATSSSQTINGAASITFPNSSTTFGRLSIYSDGVNWFAGRAN